MAKLMASRERKNSAPCIFAANESQAAKRKREDGDDCSITNDSRAVSSSAEMLELEAISAELTALVLASSNTKIEIKTKIRELAKVVRKIKNAETTTRLSEKKDAATQIETAKSRKELEAAEEIWKLIAEEPENVLETEWPNRAFRYTKVTRKNVLSASGDIMVLIDPAEGSMDWLKNQLIATHPTLEATLNEPASGKLVKLVTGVTMTIDDVRQESQKNKTTWVGLIPQAESVLLTEFVKKKLIEVLTDKRQKKITISATNIMEATKFRKLIEVELSKQVSSHRAAVEICAPLAFLPRKPVGWHTEKIVIGQGENDDVSYADLVKQLRANVNPAKIGVDIRRVSKLPSGKLQLTVRETTAGGRDALVSEIKEKANAQVEIRTNKVQVMITDLDSETTCKEISNALVELLGVDEDQMKISEIRTGRNGGRWASATLEKRLAATLIERGRLQVGWSACRVKEMLRPLSCLRCLEFGHATRECKSTEKIERKCFKCNEVGHEARSCTKDAFCGSCKSPGHRRDSTACPKYREILQAMRAKK